MPIPKPNTGETRENYVKRIVPMIIGEGKSQEEAVAIAEQMYSDNSGEAEKKPKSKIEILADIKKMLEKNNITIDDEKLIAFFQQMTGLNSLSYPIALNKSMTTQDAHEIRVFPKKSVYIDHEHAFVNLNTLLFKQMIENFKNSKLFKPFIDVEHQLGEKFGDILDLYEKRDGLYALVRLNEDGKRLVQNRVYSYISPFWGSRTDTDKILHKNVLWSITLTNIPALEGENRQLQDQIKLSKGGRKMGINKSDLSTRLAKLQGMVHAFAAGDPNAGGDEGGAATLTPEMVSEIISILNDAITSIQELTQQKATAETAALDATNKLKAIEEAGVKAEKDRFFKQVVEDGQLDAKEVEDWQHQYDASKDFVTKILLARPKKGKTGTSMQSQGTPAQGEAVVDGHKLTQEDYDVMQRQGFRNKDGSFDTHRYVKDVLDK